MPVMSAPPKVTRDGYVVGSSPKTNDAILPLILPVFANWST